MLLKIFELNAYLESYGMTSQNPLQPVVLFSENKQIQSHPTARNSVEYSGNSLMFRNRTGFRRHLNWLKREFPGNFKSRPSFLSSDVSS